ncbi:uncharacterized protein LOC132711982 [Pantherophis guttatus]|uniref:Uncharacterized protein LOC132711982 n=1 Tax=Pantherophis guttatus TaxID=94885 RepID=A0ABM3ZIE0_PANGU|nr:uncharacterized protein LOC132711982 [Pantherophis guttatus]
MEEKEGAIGGLGAKGSTDPLLSSPEEMEQAMKAAEEAFRLGAQPKASESWKSCQSHPASGGDLKSPHESDWRMGATWSQSLSGLPECFEWMEVGNYAPTSKPLEPVLALPPVESIPPGWAFYPGQGWIQCQWYPAPFVPSCQGSPWPPSYASTILAPRGAGANPAAGWNAFPPAQQAAEQPGPLPQQPTPLPAPPPTQLPSHQPVGMQQPGAPQGGLIQQPAALPPLQRSEQLSNQPPSPNHPQLTPSPCEANTTPLQSNF